jgi:hypothetical protein
LGSAARSGAKFLDHSNGVGEAHLRRIVTIRIGRPRSQGWKTFLRNQAAGIASIDLFVVRTISFKLLCLVKNSKFERIDDGVP